MIQTIEVLDATVLGVILFLLAVVTFTSIVRRGFTSFSFAFGLSIFVVYMVILLVVFKHGSLLAGLGVGIAAIASLDWLNRHCLWSVMRLMGFPVASRIRMSQEEAMAESDRATPRDKVHIYIFAIICVGLSIVAPLYFGSGIQCIYSAPFGLVLLMVGLRLGFFVCDSFRRESKNN